MWTTIKCLQNNSNNNTDNQALQTVTATYISNRSKANVFRADFQKVSKLINICWTWRPWLRKMTADNHLVSECFLQQPLHWRVNMRRCTILHKYGWWAFSTLFQLRNDIIPYHFKVSFTINCSFLENDRVKHKFACESNPHTYFLRVKAFRDQIMALCVLMLLPREK